MIVRAKRESSAERLVLAVDSSYVRKGFGTLRAANNLFSKYLMSSMASYTGPARLSTLVDSRPSRTGKKKSSMVVSMLNFSSILLVFGFTYFCFLTAWRTLFRYALVSFGGMFDTST